jgi:hypothetical protein
MIYDVKGILSVQIYLQESTSKILICIVTKPELEKGKHFYSDGGFSSKTSESNQIRRDFRHRAEVREREH